MHNLYGKVLFLFLLLLAPALTAQNCFYQLEMFDSFGDGWNGGTLTLTAGGVSTPYTLTPTLGDGEAFTECIELTDGDDLVLDYEAGSFASEVSFNLLDAFGNVIYMSAPGLPDEGDSLLVTQVECPACQTPAVCSDITTGRLRSTSVDLFYSAVGADTAGNPAVYLIEYGPSGFIPGSGEGTFVTTTDTIFRVQPLMDTTAYDIYVSTICFMGQDTSAAAGPVSIFTPLSIDLGITSLTDPISGCYLSAEEVRVGITNFGGTPQSFIPFDYSINGTPSGVNMPTDGLYTGVVGVDSTEFTSFDLMPSFAEPGYYSVLVWTAKDGDQDLSNDTMAFEVFSAPQIADFPYFETFEENDGFWSDQRNDSLSSWEYGTPNGDVISTAADGTGAWVTNLDGDYPINELSYLYSPCFDFSTFTEDPIIYFDLFLALATGADNLQLEATTNNQDYFLVGGFGEGLNWYNDQFNDWWDNNGALPLAWTPTALKLDGFAGEPRVRFRFRFSTNGFTNAEGVGVDNIFLAPQAETELVAISVDGPEGQNCGSPNDRPTINFVNIGSGVATSIDVYYQANGGDIVMEDFPGILTAFQQGSYTFDTPYDGSQQDVNEIVAWVEVSGDDFSFNDTVRVSLRSRFDLPFFEDFEDGMVDEGWNIDNFDVIIANAHGSGSVVLYDNLYSFDPGFVVSTPNYGPLQEGDSLIFDYRYVNFGSGTATLLAPGDSLSIGFIVDCAEDTTAFFTVTNLNHSPTTAFTTISLPIPEQFWGSAVQVVFQGQFAVGSTNDYYLDLDNINLKRCTGSLEIDGDVANAADSSSLGRITALPGAGAAPYTYVWSNGETTATIDSLAIGQYTVTVTDAQGCSDVATFSIIVSGIQETILPFGSVRIYPNPTAGAFHLEAELSRERHLQLQLFNQYGQRLKTEDYGQRSQLRETLDLSGQPAGIYFLRLLSEGEQRTIRVVKTR